MEELRLTYQQVAMYAVAANVIISALFGAFPLIAGLRLGNRKYAFIGFVGAIALGLIGIFLSFPFAAVMHWLILRNAGIGIVTYDSSSSDAAGSPDSDLSPAEKS